MPWFGFNMNAKECMSAGLYPESDCSYHTAYIALGSNMGDRAKYLLAALRALQENDLKVEDISQIYETRPVGYTQQDMFLNMVCRITLLKEPFELLRILHKIEDDLGRKRTVQWGPRTIDLDILLYDEEHIESDLLSIPHLRMFERAFVLIPLRDIYNEEKIKNRCIDEFIETCADRDGIVLDRKSVV